MPDLILSRAVPSEQYIRFACRIPRSEEVSEICLFIQPVAEAKLYVQWKDHLKVKVVHLANMHYHRLAPTLLLAFAKVILSTSELLASDVLVRMSKGLELD